MIRPLTVLALAAFLPQLHAQQDDAGITWLAQYDGKALPAAPAWTPHGEPTARMDGSGLNLADSSPMAMQQTRDFLVKSKLRDPAPQ